MQPIFMEGKIAIFDFSNGNTSRELCESIAELMDKGYTVKLKKVTSGETDDTVQYYTAQNYSVNKSTNAITVSFDGGTLSESEWTEGGSGGETDTLWVHFTDDGQGSFNVDKTLNEVVTAYNKGRHVIAWLDLSNVNDSLPCTIAFSGEGYASSKFEGSVFGTFDSVEKDVYGILVYTQDSIVFTSQSFG